MKPALPALILTSLLAGCGADAPPPPPPAPEPTVAAVPSGPAPDCIRTLAVATLPESWRDGMAHEGDTSSRLGPNGVACMQSLLVAPVHTPADLDPAYAPLLAFHDEASGPQVASLAAQSMHLWRVSGSGAAGTWLLRVDTGAAAEGGRHDILFATSASGTLMDSLLVGGDGGRWQRTYDLSPMQLNLRESTGREQQVGPAYSAMIGVIDLRFVLVDSDVTAAAAGSGGELGNSLLAVPGRPGDLAALRAVLFADPGLREEVLREEHDGDQRRIFAIAATDVAGHVIYVLEAATAQPEPGKTSYVVTSFQSAEPPNALAATLGRPTWTKTMDGAIAIDVPVTYTFVREGAGEPPADPSPTDPAPADPAPAGATAAEGAGAEAETYEVATSIGLRYDPGSGLLSPVD